MTEETPDPMGGGGAVPHSHDTASTPQQSGCTVQAYALAKRLPEGFLRSLGLSGIHLAGIPAIRIPYRANDGTETAVRLRLALSGENRFRWRTGSKPQLYGLDRLSPTMPGDTIVLVEGESDCHTLWFNNIAALGLPGAANWQEERDAPALEQFSVIYVVIEPDQGGKAVEKWLNCSSITDRVRVVRFAEYKDPSDMWLADPAAFPARWREAIGNSVPWHAAHDDGSDPIGTNDAVGSGAAGEWEHPDLSVSERPEIPAPPFPIEVLGPSWAGWCVAAAKAANAPVDYTVTALLTTAAAMIGNARSIAPAPDWEEPCILWCVLVGVPSSGKSPALDPFTRIVRGIEADMARDFEETRQTFIAEQELASQKKASWKTLVKDALKAGKEPPRLPVDAQELLPLQCPRIMISDTTMEAAADIAAANPRGLVLIRDEFGGWWRGFNRYGGDGERQFWLQAYGARPYTVDRKKLDRPIKIQRLSVSALGGTQPDVLAKLLKGEEDGFSSRLLYCFPEPVGGFALSNQPVDFGGARAALERLHNLPMVEDGETGHRPLVCNLEPTAARHFEIWWGKWRAAANHHTGLFGGWLGKAGGLALRLALVLEHLHWSAPPSTDIANSANSVDSFPRRISMDTLKSAIRLIDDWAIPMARRAFGIAAISDKEIDAAALAGWLKRNGCRQFNSRNLRRSSEGPSGRLSKAENMAAACELLEQAGLIRFIGVRADGKPGRAKRDYEVNPALIAR
jgi:hypothetical protein